jgi:polyhydroxyalkanoate synthesis regulator phasin
MALDALRGYVALAGGLTEVTRAKATAQAKALLQDDTVASLLAGGTKAGAQVQALADEIVAAGRANRDVVVTLVRAEVERAMGSVGAAGRDEVEALRASVDRLERRVAVLESKDAASTASARRTSGTASTAKKAAKAAPRAASSTPSASASASSDGDKA